MNEKKTVFKVWKTETLFTPMQFSYSTLRYDPAGQFATRADAEALCAALIRDPNVRAVGIEEVPAQ